MKMTIRHASTHDHPKISAMMLEHDHPVDPKALTLKPKLKEPLDSEISEQVKKMAGGWETACAVCEGPDRGREELLFGFCLVSNSGTCRVVGVQLHRIWFDVAW